MKKILFAACLIMVAVFVGAESTAPGVDVMRILKKIDAMNDVGERDFSCAYELASVKPGEKPSITKVQVYERTYKDQMVYIIISPDSYGKGFLMDGDNMWIYDNTKRIFTKTSFKEQVNDTNAKNGDLKRDKYSEDYNVISTTDGMIEKYPVWIIELMAKDDSMTYPKKVLYVRKDNDLPIKGVEFGADGLKPQRTTYITKYVKVEGFILPSQTKIEDNIKIGEETTMIMSNPSLSKLKDVTFTKKFLEDWSN